MGRFRAGPVGAALFTLVIMLGGAARSARAQTGIDALLEPWDVGRNVDSESALRVYNAGHEKGDDSKLTLEQFESQSRWRLSQDLALNPTLSYDLTYFRLNGGPPRLPNQLLDMSVGASSPIMGTPDLFLAGSVAVGFAGDEPFDNDRAYYGKANAFIGHALDDDRTIMFFLDYDGNRTLFPDIPIPAVEYADESNDNFRYVIGFPVSVADWKPDNRLDLLMRVEIPESYEVELDYRLIDGLTLYASAENDDYRFAVEAIPGAHRLIFSQNRAEAGISYKVGEYAEFSLAAGYAFDQQFGEGFDGRSTHNRIDLSDEPFVRFGLELSF